MLSNRLSARNVLQNQLAIARVRADWLAENATDAEINQLEGAAPPPLATVQSVAAAVLRRLADGFDPN